MAQGYQQYDNKGYFQDKDGNKLYPNDYDTGWRNLTLLNGLVNTNYSAFPCQERKIGNIVYLRGLASGNVDANTQVTTVSFKPTNKLYFPLGTDMAEDFKDNKAKILTIDTEGKVILHGSSLTNSWLTLGGISYPID